MNWDDVRIFLAVARHGQILGAANSLSLNHATVARRLSALETALGTRLVNRSPEGSVLSREGERFLGHAEAIEREVLAAEQSTGTADMVAGTVRVGAPDGFGVAFLAGQLGELRRRHPALKVELVPVPRAFSLARREADIAITLERPSDGWVIARKLTDYSLSLYASRDYLSRAGTPAAVADLTAHALVGYVDDLLFSRSLDYAGEIFKAWRTDLAISSAMGQYEAVRAGAGIGILHRFMAGADPELVEVLPEHRLVRSYWLVVHRDLQSSRRVRAVRDFVLEAVQREARRF